MLKNSQVRKAQRFLIFAVTILTTACAGRHTKGFSRLDEQWYRQGLAAFRLSTPKGYQQAAELFRRAQQAAPGRCEYALHQAEALLFLAREQQFNWEQDYQESVVTANEIIGYNQSNPRCSSFQAFRDRLKSMYSSEGQAHELIDRAVKSEPQVAMNWLVLWRLDGTHFPDAIDHAVELDPDLAAIQYEAGNARLNRGDYIQARAAFERALQASPQHFMSELGLAYAVADLDPEAETLPYYERAVDMAPENLAARLLFGDQLSAMEDPEGAIEQYRTALKLRPDFYPASLALATVFMRSNRYEKAEQELSRLFTTNPAFTPPTSCARECAVSQAHYILGFIALQRGNPVRAEQEFQESLRLANNFDAIFGLGSLYYQRLKLDDALLQFQRAFRFEKYLKDPYHELELADLYLFRAGIRAERREFTEAVQDSTQAIEIYSRQIVRLEKQTEQAEKRHLSRIASSLRERKAEVRRQLERAEGLKKQAG
jgi:tetratricopeptide (TPR) repeat protein